MRKLVKTFVLLAIIAVILVFGKNLIVKNAVTTAVRTTTGLRLDIGRMAVGLLKPLVYITGMELYNPSGYEDPIMIDIPEIYVDYNVAAFFKRKVHLKELRLNLKELVVVKNEKGELNLNALNTASQGKEQQPPAKKEEPKPAAQKPLDMQIDRLSLKVGRVVYKDYSSLRRGQPTVREFKIDLDEQFENISDPNTLVGIIVMRALARASLGAIADLDDNLKEFAGQAAAKAQEAMEKSAAAAKEAAAQAAEKTKEAAAKASESVKEATQGISEQIKLPFGGEQQ